MPRTYSAEAVIDAPPEAVWRALTDLGAYPQWNPFTPRVRSSLKVGDPVYITARVGRRRFEQTDRLHGLTPGQELLWGMELGRGRLLRVRRTQRVEAIGGGGARYRSVETFEGPLARVVHRFMGGDLQRGVEQMAQALRARVEEGPS